MVARECERKWWCTSREGAHVPPTGSDEEGGFDGRWGERGWGTGWMSRRKCAGGTCTCTSTVVCID